ncbi:MAG: S-layer homology domain-containing protein [Lyngbya sp. HA4199-MV5]|jgi:hypothetical protein|nr:S-layer homology domain-containing protein [Lyngbya sp. HA4199-MV5]
MDKRVWKMIALTLATILVSLSLIVGQALKAAAVDPPERLVTQITSASQFEDIKESDYYFDAARSLIEQYGCFAGYPDRSLRPNRPIVRVELVALVQSCLDVVDGLAASVRPADADGLNRVRRRLDAISAAVKKVQR